jgi:hypothetical protein
MKKISQIIACFLAATLMVSCSSNDSNPTPATSTNSSSLDGKSVPGQDGKGGSMARFTISGNNLYTVDNSSLTNFDITNPEDPQQGSRTTVGFNVETIFPYQDKLFLGTQSGMIIMGTQNPASPNIIAQYSHIVSCDPVVADGRYAYVTLSTGTTCRRAIDELQIIDLANITEPRLLRQDPMVNPKGLGIDGTNLFVCDEGLKMYNASNVNSLTLLEHFNINAYDVIPDNGHLMVIGSDGFYQYEYLNNKLQLLSKIPVSAAM